MQHHFLDPKLVEILKVSEIFFILRFSNDFVCKINNLPSKSRCRVLFQISSIDSTLKVLKMEFAARIERTC